MRTSLLFAGGLWLLAGCSDDAYERAVESPESEHDPTTGAVDPPPARTAPPRPEPAQPMDIDDAAVIDPAGEPMTTPDQPPPEDASRAPLDHPTRPGAVDPVGEPEDAATPDEPTRSLDPTAAPAVDPVGEDVEDDAGEASGQN